MKTQNKAVFIIFLSLFACQAQKRYVPNFSNYINYKSKVIQYSGETQIDKNIISYRYFNCKNQLIEQVGHEYRVKFIYDKKGKLKERYTCRMYNCEIGRREILFYDNYQNYIGSFHTTDTLVNMDTIVIEPVKFYNQTNIIKELSNKGTDIYGNKYEYWKYYTYKNNRISKELETKNGDTTWIGTYKYDEKTNLIAISRIHEELYEKEFFEYNKDNILTKKKIDSNKYSLTKETSFSVKNNTTTYKYDNANRLIEEITFNHKGEKYRTFLYKYDNY